jgi:HAD superfamily hydrolase (TIGR01490 family)
MRIALFDLDHTLLPHDTQALFCNYVIRHEPWRLILHLFFIPFALARVLKLCSTATAKRAFHSYLLGMSRSKLQRYAKHFAAHSVEAWLYPELRAELMRHRHQGRTLILNTASPSFYAEAIAAQLEFDHCISTRVTIQQRVPLLPKLDGTNNKRTIKIQSMEKALPQLTQRSQADISDSWGFSDSHVDIPLLEYCGHRILIHPTSALQKHFAPDPMAVTLTPPRPYQNRLGNLLCALRQVLGLYPVTP